MRFALAAAAFGLAAVASAETARYADDQAARGERLYEVHCASCHGTQLEGGTAMPLSGTAFETRWQNGERSVDDLFYIVRTLMPYAEPGKLAKPEYLEIVSFLLKFNGYPARGPALPLDAAVLRSLILTPRSH